MTMARQGRMFVGTDFAPSIAEIKGVLRDCLSHKQQKRIHYAVASDFLAREFVKAVTAVVYDDKDAQRVYRQSAEMYEKTANVDFDKAFFPDADEAQKFIESQGLKAKRIPLFQRPVALQCAKDFNIGQYQKLESLKNESFLWEITVGD